MQKPLMSYKYPEIRRRPTCDTSAHAMVLAVIINEWAPRSIDTIAYIVRQTGLNFHEATLFLGENPGENCPIEIVVCSDGCLLFVTSGSGHKSNGVLIYCLPAGSVRCLGNFVTKSSRCCIKNKKKTKRYSKTIKTGTWFAIKVLVIIPNHGKNIRKKKQ